MKVPAFASLFAAVFFFATPVVKADNNSDNTLKFFLSKSELVVLGKITTDPDAFEDEMGVVNYTCEFKVQDVLKGDAGLKGRVIKVDIIRFERDEKDKNPLIKKGGQCILFLKSDKQSAWSWSTADFWFGVQPPSPAMAHALKRLAAKGGQAPSPKAVGRGKS